MFATLIFTSLLVNSLQKSRYFQGAMRDKRSLRDSDLNTKNKLERLKKKIFVKGNESDVISTTGIFDP